MKQITMKYKKGQWLERTNNDSLYFTKGECYKVTGITKSGTIFMKDDSGSFYGLDKVSVDQSFKPAPKTLETLEVGDVVIDRFGDERTVIEVLDNCFAFSTPQDKEVLWAWRALKEAKKENWKIKGAEDIEVEELTMEEVCKELGRTIKIKK